MNGSEAATAFLLAQLQLVSFVVFAPFLAATIRITKARLQSRRGRGLLQPYRDLAKWWGKLPVESNASGPVARYAPAFVLGAILTAALLVPGAAARAPLAGWGDLLVVVGLFAAARFAIALAALDSGSAFGGMGSSRDVAISALAEPGLVLALAGAAVAAGSTDLGTISGFGIVQGVGLLGPAHLLAAAAFGIVIIAETGHYPVDNPDTHLELTMLHEGMLLEHSGPGLACILLATHTKQLVILTLVSALFFPLGLAPGLVPTEIGYALAVFAAKVLVLALFLAVVESSYAKLRFFRVPQFLGLGLVCAFLALALRIL
jgi:formate hydrogenlyase subunit 4